MTEVTRQTEYLFVNGKFSQIIFIPIVWLRREGWHQEAESQGRAMLFNIYFTVILNNVTHQKCLLLLLKQRLQNSLINKKISMSIIQMSNSHK